MHQKTTLDNGLRIVTTTMPHTHSVSICIFVGVGSRYETDTDAGISHFIEHLYFKGTQKRPTSRDISEAIDGVGGILNAGTDKELSVYWCKVAEIHFDLALDVLVDMMLNSRFDPAEIEKERQVIIEEINMILDNPAQRANMLIDELLWPGHPLGRDIAGSKESVTAITRDQMLKYLQAQYLPTRTVVSIAGNIEHQKVVTTVNQTLGQWATHQKPTPYLAFTEQNFQRTYIETRDTEQAHLCLGLPALPLDHPKRFILGLLNVILGESTSSRLFTEVRDKLGLTYSIHSHVEHFLDSGSLTIYAGMEPKNLATTLKAILEQLAGLKETVPESELYKAKEFSKGRLLLRMEDSRSVAGWTGGQEVLTEHILGVEEVKSIIDAITPADISQLARELIVNSQLRLTVVGPITNGESLEQLLDI